MDADSLAQVLQCVCQLSSDEEHAIVQERLSTYTVSWTDVHEHMYMHRLAELSLQLC